MIGRNLTRRLKQLEAHCALTSQMPIFTIKCVAPDGMVTGTFVLGPNGARTWTDLTDPTNPRTWTEKP